MPMTDVPKTGTKNWYQTTGTSFWYVCHAIWYQIEQQNVFYSVL